jgi:hypothetical protein
MRIILMGTRGRRSSFASTHDALSLFQITHTNAGDGMKEIMGASLRGDVLVRLRAFLIHLGLSSLVALASAVLVFLLWYPLPFREMSGGRDLFFIVIAVDVVLGPCITFAIFDRCKPLSELRRDLTIVALLQLGGLVYGLHTVYLVRPVVLALEFTRLRVVRVLDLKGADLKAAPPELRDLPWWGVTAVAARAIRPEEKNQTLQLGLKGRDIGMRPEFWLPRDATGPSYAHAAKPLSELARRFPRRVEEIQSAVKDSGRSAEQLGFLPILARLTNWSALIDLRSGDVVGYVNIDSF